MSNTIRAGDTVNLTNGERLVVCIESYGGQGWFNVGWPTNYYPTSMIEKIEPATDDKHMLMMQLALASTVGDIRHYAENHECPLCLPAKLKRNVEKTFNSLTLANNTLSSAWLSYRAALHALNAYNTDNPSE